MGFNNTSRSSVKKRFLVNPKDLRFTQPDIKSTFTDPTHPSVRETASLLRRGELKPHEFGDLHVSIDEQGRMWCDNNRRLFASREAGIDLVPVVFDGRRRPKTSEKGKLSDPAFVPRIRGEASRVQIPSSPISGRKGYQMQEGSSLPGFVSGRYLCLDEEEEDELGARFTQLGIKSTFSSSAECPESLSGASGVRIPPLPTSEQNAYHREKEPSLLGFVSGGYLCIDEEGEDVPQKELCEDESKTEYCISAFSFEDVDEDEDNEVEYCISAFSSEYKDEDEDNEVEYCISAFSFEDREEDEDNEVEHSISAFPSEHGEEDEDNEVEYCISAFSSEHGEEDEDNEVEYCISAFSVSSEFLDEVEDCYSCDDDYE